MSVFTSLVRGVCLLSVWLGLMLAGCQPLPPGEVEALSNRPQTWTKFVAIVRLQGEPLLAALRVAADGREVIDAEHKDALLEEQERVIAELQALSDEVVVLYRYHLVLNALAVVAPESIREQMAGLDGVVMVANETIFNPPEPYVEVAADDEGDREGTPLTVDSAAFIGSRTVHEKLRAPNRDGVPVPVRGEGVRVAIIDTGIDYTHKAFGGSGIVADYKNNDAAVIEPDTFPTRKVVAGIDLVGTGYDPSEGDIEQHIPHGDPDPLDESMHGTHVAGIVAGVGDGVNTHDGVAPDAMLMAIRVFAAGSTSDTVIIRALEYALDPNGDFDLSDRAQVANLSLGSGFGAPNSLYVDAIANALQGGMVVVAAAGNSGAYDYIVSEPSTADAAISVAASVDDAQHNWKIPAIKFSGDNGSKITAEAAESPMAKPIAAVGELVAPVYHIGLAAQDLTVEQQEQLRGKVALIDRGLVTFVAKLDRAVAAGAVGIVMVNNVAGAPLMMGGTAEYQIPAVMITKRAGAEVKTALQEGAVSVTFKDELFLERRELIDSLASFSSYGPRTFDSLLKPEIAAPGVAITSAFSGHGNRGIRVSGTSMATPHISGVVALMRQYRPLVKPALMKNMVMANTKLMRSPGGARYRTYQQGGGRVEAWNAVTAEVIFQPATLSLGRMLVSTNKKIAGQFALQNLGEQEITVTLHADVVSGLTFTMPTQVTLAAGAQARVDFELLVAAAGLKQPYANLDGYLEARRAEQVVARLPLLLGVQRLARVNTQRAIIHASSEDDAYRAVINVELANDGVIDGEVLLFNLLGHDARMASVRRDLLQREDSTCDLQSAGYRIVEQVVDEQKERVLQFAAKFYHPRTTWNYCGLSVQFDADGDGVADQELVGDTLDSIRRGSSRDANMFLAFLTDAHKLRAIRAAHELQGTAENYTAAVVSVLPLNIYNHSTLMVASARWRDVLTNADGDVRIRLAAAGLTDPDYLTDHKQVWHTITPTIDGVGFWDMPDSTVIAKGSTGKVTLSKGGDPAAQLIAYFPHNASTFSLLRADQQSSVLEVSYQP